MSFTTLISGYSYFEGPRWHQGRLWLSDFFIGQVIAVGLDGAVEKIAEVPQRPSGLGWLPDGRLLVVSQLDRKVLRREADGRMVVHADLAAMLDGPANDMVVEPGGRAWVGNYGFDLTAADQVRTARLVCVEPDGRAAIAAENLFFPNGLLITADGKTLIVAESLGNRISAFDIGANGGLGPRRDWAVFGPLVHSSNLLDYLAAAKVAPDGTALDAEGAIWLADAVGHRVLRVAEGGRLLQEISTGSQGAFACALGGDDGRTLFICVDFHEAARQAAREAEVWMTRVDIPGA